MIKKFNQFNESLLDKLQGPNKDDVFKSFGYEKGFDTPEDFFLDVIDDMKVKEQIKYTDSVFWEKNGEILFEQDLNNMEIWVNYQTVWKIFEEIFHMNYIETQSFIKSMVEEHLNWNGFTPVNRLIPELQRWKNI